MDPIREETADPSWKNLYLVGGVTPLIGLFFIITQILTIVFGGEPFPSSVESWLELLGRRRVLGLVYLNSLDILTISLLGPMFLAIYAALRRAHKSFALIAVSAALLGITVFVSARSNALSVLSLTGQYAAAATDEERSIVVSAGNAVLLGNPVPQTPGFFFMSVAVLVFSILMLRGGVFGRVMAWTGILAGAFVFIDDASLALAPSLSGALMIPAGGAWLIWWIMASVKLLRLARGGGKPDGAEDA